MDIESIPVLYTTPESEAQGDGTFFDVDQKRMAVYFFVGGDVMAFYSSNNAILKEAFEWESSESMQHFSEEQQAQIKQKMEELLGALYF